MKNLINAIKIILAIALMSPAIMLVYDAFAYLMFLPQFSDWIDMTRGEAISRILCTVVWGMAVFLPADCLIESID